MAYITLSQLKTQFGEAEVLALCDQARDGVIDMAVVDQAISEADAIIDGYLVGRYDLPLDPVPAILVPYTGDIWRYRRYDQRATQQVTERYLAALDWLKMVAKGQIALTVPTGAVAETGGTFAVTSDDAFWPRGAQWII